MVKWVQEENMAKSKRKTLGKGPFAKRKKGIRRGTGR